jgi:hypothetical protein
VVCSPPGYSRRNGTPIVARHRDFAHRVTNR